GREEKGVWIRVDGGEGYDPSNAGFINRQVRAVLADKTERGRVYAGVIFDRVSGGLFVSEDAGITWRQSMSGMGVRDVYSLYQSDSNPATIYAGTNQGLFPSDDHGSNWTLVKKEEKVEQSEATSGTVTNGEAAASENNPVPHVSQPVPPPIATTPTSKGPVRAQAKSRNGKVASASRSKSKKEKPRPPRPPKPDGDKLVDLQNQIFAILPLTPLNAANGAGEGDSQAQPNQPTRPIWMIASTWDGLFLTKDEKKGWREIKFPKASEKASGADAAAPIKINTIVTNPNAPGAIFIGTDEGLFVSRDNGE